MISITAAQRYSILVTARNDTSQNWAIHANMDTDMFDDLPPNLNPSKYYCIIQLKPNLRNAINPLDVTSSITYSPSAPLDTSGTVDEYTDTVDFDLVPIPAEPQLPPATHTIPLLVVFDTTDAGTNRAMFNSVTFNSPVVPGVFSMLSLARGDGGVGEGAAEVAEAYGPWSYVLGEGDVVDLVLMNSDAGKHPL
jgi:iron transport multicopper oxidase